MNNESVVRYAVEGLYVDRAKSNPSDKPDQWVRSWQTWMECSSLERVNAVMNNGLKIMRTKEYSGFIALRVVKITEQREVISHGV